MGILDQLMNMNPQQSEGLLAAAAQMLQMSGPSQRPVGFGQVMGGGLQAYQQSSEAARRRKLEEEQAKQMAEMRGLQMQDMQGGMEDRKLARQQAMLPKPVKYSMDVKTANDPDGKPFSYVMDENGNPKRLDGVLPRDPMRLAKLGGKDVAYNEFALQPGQAFEHTESPDSKASRAVQIRGQNMADARGRESNEIARGKLTGMDKPMPATALKMQQAEIDALGTASGVQMDISRAQQQIKDGKLDFGLIGNLVNRGRNAAGMSTEESRNFASFQSGMEKMRNDSLRLNAGVQTDGDAQRAWNELFANINDKGVVAQRLEEIKNINARAVQLRKMNIDGIRANYGREPLDTSKYEPPTAPKAPGAPGDIEDLLKKYGGG